MATPGGLFPGDVGDESHPSQGRGGSLSGGRPQDMSSQRRRRMILRQKRHLRNKAKRERQEKFIQVRKSFSISPILLIFPGFIIKL